MERVRDGAYNYKGVSELPAFLICRFLFRAAADKVYAEVKELRKLKYAADRKAKGPVGVAR